MSVGERSDEALEAGDAAPAGERVVADAEQPARPQHSGGKVEQSGLVVGADPGEHALRDDIVRHPRRNVSGVGEAATLELDIVEPDLAGERLPARDMRGHRVDAQEAAFGISGGQQDQSGAVAAAEVDEAERPAPRARRPKLLPDEAGVERGRREARMEGAGVKRVGNVAVDPGQLSPRPTVRRSELLVPRRLSGVSVRRRSRRAAARLHSVLHRRVATKPMSVPRFGWSAPGAS
jgi:hypothetical protein